MSLPVLGSDDRSAQHSDRQGRTFLLCACACECVRACRCLCYPSLTPAPSSEKDSGQEGGGERENGGSSCVQPQPLCVLSVPPPLPPPLPFHGRAHHLPPHPHSHTPPPLPPAPPRPACCSKRHPNSCASPQGLGEMWGRVSLLLTLRRSRGGQPREHARPHHHHLSPALSFSPALSVPPRATARNGCNLSPLVFLLPLLFHCAQMTETKTRLHCRCARALRSFYWDEIPSKSDGPPKS